MKSKKSWKTKFEETCSQGFPKVIRITKEQSGMWGTKEGDTIAIPSPMDILEIIRTIPRGYVTTVNLIREVLSRKYGVSLTCPITTGIFLMIVANMAEEESAGKESSIPYWRLLKSRGEINPKYPGGIEKNVELLKMEGHEFIFRKNNVIVKDWDKKLWNNF